MRRANGLLLAGAATTITLVLAACTTVGPNYHLPEAAVAKAPGANAPFLSAAAQAPGIATGAPLPDRWWHLYNDPVLDDLEAQALALLDAGGAERTQGAA